jgi:membrane protein implicated in regulation of membrane protease activity
VTDRSIGGGTLPDEHRVGTPGVVLIGLGAVAFVVCVAGFALGWVGCGTWAGIVALLASAAGLAWLTDEGRRQRGSRPLIPLNRPGPPPPAATGVS